MKHDERTKPLRWTLCCVLAVAGCNGGAISQSDMARYSLRNPPEEEEEPTQPAPAKPVAKPPAKQPVERVASLDRTQKKQPAARAQDESVPADAISEPLTDTESPPRTPLAPEERAKRSAANLERIAAAFQKHLDKKGYYPARAIFNGEDANLSWRVALLPDLGYQRLFDEFRLDEPWNSRHNYELLKQIPSVYQSPERFDDHTNYVIPADSSTVFRGKGVVRLSDFEDGAKNTVMVVEADDVAAVPWTAPREFEPDARAPGKNLGALRGDSFFLIWGNAEVGRVLAATSQDQLRAMFTHDAGENFTSGQVDQPLFVTPSRAARPASTQTAGTQPAENSAPTAAAAPIDAATSSLVADYSQLTSESLSLDREGDAVGYFYAAALAGPGGGAWSQQYKWVPAVRRPAAVVRFGIGLQYEGPQLVKQPRAWSTVTGDFGAQLVDVLANHVSAHGNSSLMAQDATKRKKSGAAPRRASARPIGPSGQFAPGVAFLGESRESALRKLAERDRVDLLLLVNWRESARGWSVGMELVDVVRGTVVWKMPRVLSSQVERAKANPLHSNPLDDALREFAQFLEAECVFRPMPEQLKARHTLSRVTALSTNDEPEPLRALAEMRLYHELGLIDAPQLMRAYQAKIGVENAIQLLLGSADAKRQLLKPLLPTPPLVADRSRAASRRTDADE